MTRPRPQPASSRHCAECSYDLTGTPPGAVERCPECGLLLTDHSMAVARERTLFRDLRRRTAAALIVAGLLGLAAAIVFRDHVLFLVPLLVLVVTPLVPVLLAACADRRLSG